MVLIIIYFICSNQSGKYQVMFKEGAHNVVDDYSRYIMSTTLFFNVVASHFSYFVS